MNPYRKRADDLAAQIEALKSEAKDILSRDDADVSEEDEAIAQSKVEEATRLKADYDEATRKADELDALEEVVVRGETTEEGEHSRLETINVNTRTDPFDGADKWRATPNGVYFGDGASSEDVRSRLETVIEKHIPEQAELPDSIREGLTKTANKRSNRFYDADLVRAHMIETSRPEYLEAFETYCRTAGKVENAAVLHNRAAMSLTAANGGVTIPQFLDPTIHLTNAGIVDQVRGAATVVQITVDQWDGVTSAGVSAEWLAEAAAAADASPTFVGPTITPLKEAAWVMGSVEVLMDSSLSNEVGMLLADAFERLEGTSHATGNGVTQPTGLVTALSGTGPTLAGSSGAAGAADFVAADVYALDNGLDPRWRNPNTKFLANKAIYNEVRKMGTANTYHAFWVDFGGGRPSSLIGYECLENSAMDSTIVSGSNDDVLLLGDLKQYYLVDRIGVNIQYVPTLFSGGKVPTGQAGWFAFKRHGANVITSNAFRLLRL